MQANRVALTDRALTYLRKKKIDAISVDPVDIPCCGVPSVINDSVSKGKPTRDPSVYKKEIYEGIEVYYPYYTNVDSEVLEIDLERILGIARLYVANARIES